LDTLGLRYIQATEYRGTPGEDRASVELPLFTHINPGWSAENWVSVASCEGDEYMGGCCGNLSGAQDEVSGWFRHHSDAIPIRDLSGIITELLIPHGGFEQFEDGDWVVEGATDADSMVAIANLAWDTLLAYDKLAIVWKLVKDHFTPEIPTAYWPKDEPEEKAEDAIAHLSRLSWGISVSTMFADPGHKPTGQKKARRALALAKIIPILRTLSDHITTLDYGNFDGWALVDLSKEDDAVCTNGYGMCLYDSMIEVEKVLALWKRDDANHEERKEDRRIEKRIGIRPVRVGWEIEDGYEFTGPVERVETYMSEE
jgi:hypothetical protein